jgi:hypothetical protein
MMNFLSIKSEAASPAEPVNKIQPARRAAVFPKTNFLYPPPVPTDFMWIRIGMKMYKAVPIEQRLWPKGYVPKPK